MSGEYDKEKEGLFVIVNDLDIKMESSGLARDQSTENEFRVSRIVFSLPMQNQQARCLLLPPNVLSYSSSTPSRQLPPT